MSLQTLDPITIITTLGYIGLFSIVLAESGIFVGFFLPGDSLLFTAGLLASQGVLNIWALLIIIPIAAAIGDSIGYWFGSWVGPKLFTKDDSFFFNKKHIDRSRAFYATYGPRAIVLARFMPIVRTFVPIVAGVASMHYKTFVFYNIVGSLLWGAGVTLLGYFLGRSFPEIEHYLLPIIGAIVIVSLLPIALEWWRSKKN